MSRKISLEIISTTILFCCAILIGANQASALGTLSADEEAMFSQNDILFYEPCSTQSTSSTLGGEITISGATAEEKVWSGLASFLTDEQAAGIMGNIAQEDGNYNPLRREVGQSGGLYNRSVQMGLGLVQWSFGRRVNLLNHVKERDSSLIEHFENDSLAQITGDELIKKLGDDIVNKLYQVEIEFLKSEIDKGYKDYYKQTNPEDAAVWFEREFERAGVPNNEYRKKKAREAFDKYAGKTISGSSGSAGDGTGVSCDANFSGSNNINATAVALAWPYGTDKKVFEYTQSNGLQSKAAYNNISKWTGGKATDAFNKAIDEVYPNRKWSQCPRIGASCDVFVGTSVRYSGYDKEWPRGLGDQVEHAKKNPELWEYYPNAHGMDPQPGDVVNTGGHTYIVVQDEKGDFYRAEAGLCHNFGRISRKFNGFESGSRVFRAKKANNSTAGVSVTKGVSASSTSGTISSNSTTGNHDIGASAFYFAWPYGEFQNKMKPESKDAWYKMAKENGVNVKGHVTEGASCVVFVWGTLRYAGLISNFEISERLDNQLEKEPEWQKVAEGSIKEEDLQDGDVLIRRCYRHGKDHYPCHYGIYAEKDGQGYTVEASNPSGCGDSGGCNYAYPHVSRKGVGNGWSEAWRNSNNKHGGSTNCDLCAGQEEGDGSAVGLKEGGMTLAEAKEFIKQYHDAAMGKYYKKNITISFQGATITAVDCPFGVMNNCVAFSQWFINKYTSIGPSWDHTTNGVGLANKLVTEKGLKAGTAPRPYAIFSKAGPSAAGHTGVILGVDTKNKQVVVGEASCSSGQRSLYYEPQAKTYTFNEIKSWNYAYTDDVIKMSEGGGI